MRQYGKRTHGGYEAPPVRPGDEQPPTGGSVGKPPPSSNCPPIPGPIPLLTDPGLAQLARLIEDNTRAVRDLTVAVRELGSLEVTATAGNEVLRLEVKS